MEIEFGRTTASIKILLRKLDRKVYWLLHPDARGPRLEKRPRKMAVRTPLLPNALLSLSHRPHHRHGRRMVRMRVLQLRQSLFLLFSIEHPVLDAYIYTGQYIREGSSGRKETAVAAPKSARKNRKPKDKSDGGHQNTPGNHSGSNNSNKNSRSSANASNNNHSENHEQKVLLLSKSSQGKYQTPHPLRVMLGLTPSVCAWVVYMRISL